MQYVAKISCRNSAEGVGEGVKGRFYRIVFDMLHNLLQDNANVGGWFVKANFKIKINFFEKLLQKKPAKARQPQQTCGLQGF